MDTHIDWKSFPYPWDEIGPKFREECEAIVNQTPAEKPHKDDCQAESPDV